MIDASLAQLVTDENEVFVREGDTTLLMLGSRVRAPEEVRKGGKLKFSAFFIVQTAPYS